MTYSIKTKDGIRITGIPDDVPEDSQELKDRVAKERALRGSSASVTEEAQPPSTPASFGREAGIVARGAGPGVVSGLTGWGGAELGALAGTPFFPPFGTIVGTIGGGIAGYLAPNLLAGDKMQQFGDFIGLPRAENKEEKALQAMSEAVAGTITPMGAIRGAGMAGVKIASPKVAEMLTAAPAMQVYSSALGASVSEMTENPYVGLFAALTPVTLSALTARFREPVKDVAKRLWQNALAIKDAEGNVIGHHAVDSDVGLQLRHQLEGENGKKHLQSLLDDAARVANESIPADTKISAPIIAGQQGREAAITAADLAAEQAKAEAAKRLPPVALLRSEISQKASATIDVLEKKTKKIEETLWKPIEHPKIKVNMKTPGGLSERIAALVGGHKKDVKVGYPETVFPLTQLDLDVIAARVKEFDDLGKYTPFREVKALRTGILEDLRVADLPPRTSRVLKLLVKAIDDGLDASVTGSKSFTPEIKAQYDAARAFTKERAEKFSGPYLEGVFKEGRASGAPSEMLGKIITGTGDAERVAELANLLKPMRHPDGSELGGLYKNSAKEIESAIDQHLSSELINQLGIEKIGNPDEIRKFIRKYEDVLKAAPNLKQKFGNIEAVQNSAYEAINNARALKNNADIGLTSKFFKVDSSDPEEIASAFAKAVRSNEPDSVSKILSGIPVNDNDAKNGLKRLAFDYILSGSEKSAPHELIGKYGNKLGQIFDTPQQRAFLTKISESSELLSRYNKVDKVEQQEISELLSKYGFIPALVGRLRATGIYIGAGLGISSMAKALALSAAVVAAGGGLGGGAIVGRKLVNFLGGAKRDQVVDLLKDGLLNPATATALSTPRDPKTMSYLAPILAGIRGTADNAATPKEQSEPENRYIPPAITDAKAARAVQRAGSP